MNTVNSVLDERPCTNLACDPELGDLLPDLAARGIDCRIVDPPRWVDPCGACPDRRGLGQDHIADAVADVIHLSAAGQPLPEPVCAGCLWEAVAWWRHLGRAVTVRAYGEAA